MKKLAFLVILVLLAGLIVGCNNNNEEVHTNVEVNVGDLNIEGESNEPVENEDVTENNEEGESDENENNENSGSTETDSEDTGTESGEPEDDGAEPEDNTEGESGSSEDTGNGGAPSDSTEGEDTTPENEETVGEVTEPEEEVDYTALISKPYDDVDYSPQTKTTNFESNPAVNAKGVFITANTAASSRLDEFVTLLNETELNALVIDVKNDDGDILFYSEAAAKYVPEANNGVQIEDMEAFMKIMKDNNIYTIARIVTFKSPQYATLYPERAIAYKSSGNLYYADGAYWASPFDQELWQYNVEVAKEAINHGFNEIQFDYVRFPATGSKLDRNLDFRNAEDNSKTYAIQEFVKYAYSEINQLEAYIALDVFGWTATTINDSGIGQHWEGMSNVTDYMCPMVYPSHYGPNNFGLSVPDANPYQTVYESMSDAIERNANIETPAALRPWLQGFTAGWVVGNIPYRKAEIQAQIQACADLGIEDYIFWNSSNNYNKGWFNEE